MFLCAYDDLTTDSGGCCQGYCGRQRQHAGVTRLRQAHFTSACKFDAGAIGDQADSSETGCVCLLNRREVLPPRLSMHHRAATRSIDHPPTHAHLTPSQACAPLSLSCARRTTSQYAYSTTLSGTLRQVVTHSRARGASHVFERRLWFGL
jgi:hypothetical protein